MRRWFEKVGFALVVGSTPACFAPTGNGTETAPETGTSSGSTGDTTATTTGATGSTGVTPTTGTTTGTTSPAATTGTSSGSASTASTATTMLPESCDDGVLDGDETDVDCGGSCPPCEDDEMCAVNGDCASQACKSGVCLGDPACTDEAPCGPSALACHASACVDFACVDEPLDDVVCDDGLVCTSDDACVAGACLASTPKAVFLADVALNPALGHVYDGALAAQLAGSSVALGGDVNGDGELDILIATRLANGTPARVYVVFGGPSLATATLAGVEAGMDGFMIVADTNDPTVSVASVGDVNKDGFNDVLIGTPYNMPFLNKGGAYVVFGKADTAPVQLSAIGASGFALRGPNTTQNSQFGTSVAGLGDVNQDGWADFAVGAPAYRIDNVSVGAVFIVYGASFPATDNVENYVATNKARRIDGPATMSQNFGKVVAPVGDFNNDGNLDLAVGQPSWDSRGRVFVLYLPDPLVSFQVPDALPPDQGLIVTSITLNGQLGGALGPAGDFDGDGVHDLVIGSNGNLNKAYVVRGGNIGGTIDAADLVDEGNGFIVSGLPNELLGASVWGGLDVDGDGRRDVVLGAPGYSGGIGRAYVAFGRAMPAAIATSDLVAGTGGFAIEGQAPLSNAGAAVALMTDVNGDGRAEVLLGAPNFDPMAVDNAGRAYLVHGGACHP